MRTLIIAVLAAIVVVGAGVWYFNRDSEPTQAPTDNTPGVTTYTLGDVAKHSTPDNCWFAVSGKVYDVTSFIASGRHPGGEAIVAGCGRDATSLFFERPMGSGTPHSAQAEQGLSNFYIGELTR